MRGCRFPWESPRRSGPFAGQSATLLRFPEPLLAPVSRPSTRWAPAVSLIPAHTVPTRMELWLPVVPRNRKEDPHCTMEKAGLESIPHQ